MHGKLQGPGDAKSMQSTPLSRFQNTIEYNPYIGRRFKACRTCRKHKLKCERKNDCTCQRCHDNAIQCVYDTVGSRKRQTAGTSGDVCARRFVG